MKTPRTSLSGRASLRHTLAAAATMAIVVSFAASPAARAQDTATLPTQNVSITLSDAPVRTALDGLFKSTNLNYTIDPNIQEDVTVTLHNVPFETALKTILRSSTPELRYSVSDGVYKIYAPAADQANQSIPSAGTPQTGYPGASGTTGGGPNIGYGPNANTGLNASTTDTKQLVLIKLTYAPGALLNAVVGPVQIIAPQLYTPGASSTGSGTGGIGGGGNTGGISGGGISSGGFGGSSSGFGGTSSFGR